MKLKVTEIDANKVVINMRLNNPALKPKEQSIVKEQLLFDNQTNNLSEQFRTQFTIDEESLSPNESELLFQGTSSEALQTTSDVENVSWITQKLSTRKLRKKQATRDRNSLIEESIVEDDVAEVNDLSLIHISEPTRPY